MAREITDIKKQKKNSKRLSIYLNGEFGFGLSTNSAHVLKIGQVLSEEKIRDLLMADEFEISLQKTLNLLGYRSRSEHEIRQFLKKHKINENIITQVVNRLKENKLVDDVAFAKLWVENRSEFKPKGRMILKRELLIKGLNLDIIEDVIQDIEEEELAYRAAKKQSRKYQRLNRKEYRNKMHPFLARRGFNYEVAKSVTEKTWQEVQIESES